MATMNVKCPKCGNAITFNDSACDIFCTYCGEKIDLSAIGDSVHKGILNEKGETEVTVFYTKPFFGKTPYIVAIVDDTVELQLQNRVKTSIFLKPGEHKLTLRPLDIFSIKNNAGTDVMIDVTGEDVFNIKFSGKGNEMIVLRE